MCCNVSYHIESYRIKLHYIILPYIISQYIKPYCIKSYQIKGYYIIYTILISCIYIYMLKTATKTIWEFVLTTTEARGNFRGWSFAHLDISKPNQGWFQGLPIMGPLCGKFPIPITHIFRDSYGSGMGNSIIGKGSHLLGVPDPTDQILYYYTPEKLTAETFLLVPLL